MTAYFFMVSMPAAFAVATSAEQLRVRNSALRAIVFLAAALVGWLGYGPLNGSSLWAMVGAIVGTLLVAAPSLLKPTPDPNKRTR